MSATALPSQPTQASPRPVDTAAPATGFWVQLGAFSQRDGAASFQEKVARQMPALKLTVFSENGIHRLQAGPYASRESALAAGEQVRNGLGLAPVVVERR